MMNISTKKDIKGFNVKKTNRKLNNNFFILKNNPQKLFFCLTSLALFTNVGIQSVDAQSITKDGSTPTNIDRDGNNINIGGGARAGDNLFHSFEKFGLTKDQVANFLSNPDIENILGRVTGGDASYINGTINVGGNANLFLINPAGIVFGKDAMLNIPGSFTATTANGIKIGDFWFDALGSNDYSNLVGNPNSFAFVTDNPGSIVNAGTIQVGQGETINLVGGVVINTGTLEAEGGNINITAVPEKQLVEISPEGSLLSLALPMNDEGIESLGTELITPQDLPTLLTGSDTPIATGVEVADNGTIKLTGSDMIIPSDTGTALITDNQIQVTNSSDGTSNTVVNEFSLSASNVILQATEQITFGDANEDNDTISFENLTAIVAPPENQTGVMQVFDDLKAFNLILENQNGDINIGKSGEPVEINVVNFSEPLEIEPNNFRQEIQILIDSSPDNDNDGNADFFGENPDNIFLPQNDSDRIPVFEQKSEGGSVNIISSNGSVNLIGQITLDGQDTLTINANRFRATEPITKTFNSTTKGDSQITYNIGVEFFGGDNNPIDGDGIRIPEQRPNIQLTVQLLNELLDNQQPQSRLIKGNNTDVIDSKINIILNEDVSLGIGNQFNINNIDSSGIEEQIVTFSNLITDGSIVSPGGNINNRAFGSGLINFTEDDNNIAQEESETEFIAVNLVDETQTASFCNEELDINSIAGSDQIKATCGEQALAFVFTQPTDEEGNPVTITEDLFPELLTGDEVIEIDENTSFDFWLPKEKISFSSVD